VIRAAALGPLVLLACSRAAVAPSSTAAPSHTAAPDWAYDVSATAGAKELAVSVYFPAGSESELSLEDGAEPFVRDVATLQPNG
jgi:hypothetical protein